MSKFMLNDDDAIDDVNPFVTHDFSLPGGVRQTGDFEDFSEMKLLKTIETDKKSVFCKTGLCKDQIEPLVLNREIHPRRNFSCPETKKKVKVGVSNQKFPIRWIIIAILIFILVLLFLRR